MTMMTVGCETRKKFKKISKKVLTNYRIGAIINIVLGWETWERKKNIAELCNGSTTDSDSVCWGSNPYSAAMIKPWLCSRLNLRRGVAQLGGALRSGRRGRRFESCHLDQSENPVDGSWQDFRFIISYLLYFIFYIKTLLSNDRIVERILKK